MSFPLGDLGAGGRRLVCRGLAAAAVLAAVAVQAQTVRDLEVRAREWLELSRARAELESDWREQGPVLEDEERLLTQQLARLQETLGAKRTELERVRQELARSSDELEELRAVFAGLEPVMTLAEQELTGRQAWLSGPLGQSLASAFAQLVVPVAAERGLTAVAERLQLILGLYASMEQLNRGVHSGRVVVERGGEGRERVEMEVLYVGLAIAYAVSPDNRLAAIGRPGSNGWSWTWEPGLAQSVRRLHEVYRRERTAAFVTVPVAVDPEVAP